MPNEKANSAGGEKDKNGKGDECFTRRNFFHMAVLTNLAWV